MEYPPTIIVVHERERRSKCSVEPLRGRPGFGFLGFPLKNPPDLRGYVRLALEGPLLGEADRGKGLLVLDATWRLVAAMESAFGSVPARRLPEWRTAYPRVSKIGVDPEGGLATIEAIYAAHALLGRETAGLLDHYRWSREFLECNEKLLGGLHALE